MEFTVLLAKIKDLSRKYRKIFLILGVSLLIGGILALVFIPPYSIDEKDISYTRKNFYDGEFFLGELNTGDHIKVLCVPIESEMENAAYIFKVSLVEKSNDIPIYIENNTILTSEPIPKYVEFDVPYHTEYYYIVIHAEIRQTVFNGTDYVTEIYPRNATFEIITRRTIYHSMNIVIGVPLTITGGIFLLLAIVGISMARKKKTREDVLLEIYKTLRK